MKKLLALLLTVVLMVSFTACRNVKPDSSSEQSSTENYIQTSEESITNDVVSEVGNIESVDETTKTTSEVESQIADNTENVSSETSSKQETNSIESTVTSSEEEIVESKIEDVPQVEKATADDVNEIALLVAEYINESRNKNGVAAAEILAGLSEYAKYRSGQIVTNFTHDTLDERVAATALEYGKYTDPQLFGVEGEPFYSAEAIEAIVKTDYLGSKEQVARSIVNLVTGSSSHWSYVGHADNKYIGVGITYENGIWYCDIAVSKENYEK